MKFVSIIGARPEFVQVGVLSKRLRRSHEEITIHTGQHYDARMSDVFFAELDLPEPEINLGITGSDPSAQTGEMLAAIARALDEVRPDAVIVRGDTNSTIAGALAAKQRLYPLVHVEAGCRSYDMTMPEEINRVATDRLADLNLTVDAEIARNLEGEGNAAPVRVVGDVMFDTYLHAVDRLASVASVLPELPETYDLLTMHRAENVDDETRLRAILDGFAHAVRPIVFPMHPRTRARIASFGIALPSAFVTLDPIGYFDMLRLERGATVIFTDSGGVQREAYFGGVPCVTVRDTTEWTNTVDAGWNRLVAADTVAIAGFAATPPTCPTERPPIFGNGDAADRIVAELESTGFVATVERLRAVRTARGR
jgi:UDP-N-acetylglucosamine 2-epimerase